MSIANCKHKSTFLLLHRKRAICKYCFEDLGYADPADYCSKHGSRLEDIPLFTSTVKVCKLCESAVPVAQSVTAAQQGTVVKGDPLVDEWDSIMSDAFEIDKQ